MEATDLLAREEEFKKLNKQLEKKTESLMRQIEQAMQKQDIFSEFSNKRLTSPLHTSKKHFYDTPSSTEFSPKITPKSTPSKTLKKNNKEMSSNSSFNLENGTAIEKTKTSNIEGNGLMPDSQEDIKIGSQIICSCCSLSQRNRINDDLEFLYAFVSVSVKENVLPVGFMRERATVESVCKFLSNKVKLLQEQIDKLQNTINKKATQCESHLTKLAELESERLSLTHKTNSLEAAQIDSNAKRKVLMAKLEEKDRLYKEQRSNADKLSLEVKQLRASNTTLAARCASHNDSVAGLKHELDEAKRSQKELRDSIRSLTATHESAISRFEQRNRTLSTRNARQESLIQNLRKQIALLSANRTLLAFENEYDMFLKAF